jgi:flagellin FlaB
MDIRKTSLARNNRKNRRGVIGIEAAIVLIAFVIVAAALAFVVLNMGFSTTQKAKTTIGSGLSEASSALEVSGIVTGTGDITNAKLKTISIPIKVAAGGSSINLAQATSAIKYFSKSVNYDNIYKGTLSSTTYSNILLAAQAAKDKGYINANPVNSTTAINGTSAFIYWTVNLNNNDILDSGENAVVVVVQSDSDRPSALDQLTTEVIVPSGSPLSINRQVPSITDAVVNLS